MRARGLSGPCVGSFAVSGRTPTLRNLAAFRCSSKLQVADGSPLTRFGALCSGSLWLQVVALGLWHDSLGALGFVVQPCFDSVLHPASSAERFAVPSSCQIFLNGRRTLLSQRALLFRCRKFQNTSCSELSSREVPSHEQQVPGIPNMRIYMANWHLNIDALKTRVLKQRRGAREAVVPKWSPTFPSWAATAQIPGSAQPRA